MARGDLTPSEATELTKIVDASARHEQFADIEVRLQKLEEARDGGR